MLKYSFDGKARWFTIGKFGAPWTVGNARAEARRLTGRIAEGVDPMAEKHAAKLECKQAFTIGELCDRYMEAAEAGLILTRFNRPKKASTLEIDKGRIKRHIKPLIGGLPVKDVDAPTVRRLISDITLGKTADDAKTGLRGRAIVKGGAGTAARVADLFSGIMAWAVEEQIIPTNPVHGVKRYRGEPKDRFLSEAELARLGAVLTAGVAADGRAVHPYAVRVLWLLSLTGCRLGEIAGLRWMEVDAKDRCLGLDDTKRSWGIVSPRFTRGRPDASAPCKMPLNGNPGFSG